MDELKDFEVVGGHAEFRPSGEVKLLEMVRLVTSALAFAREQRIARLLVVTTDLSGFDPPLLAERYFFVHEWAKAAAGEVRASFVARPEMIDPHKFGVTVATNIGFAADIFPEEKEALAWLEND